MSLVGLAPMQPPDLTAVPTTDPVSIYRWRDGLYAADLLTAALVSLDFFTWMEGREATAEEICAGLELKARPVDVMLTLFVAMGYLERSGGVLRLTRLGREHLVRHSPWFIGPYFASLRDRPVVKDMVAVLRTDRAANWGSFQSAQDWARAMEQPEFAASFTAAMDCRGVYLAQAAAKSVSLAGRRRLLDVAGGSGIYACSMVAHHPGLEAAVFEKPPVDRVAAEAISKRGCSNRVKVVAGDMFAGGLPEGFDVHLISNVLHDWDTPKVMDILEKSSSSLPAGGLLIIHDAFINNEKTGPLPVAAYSAMLMHSTEGKCYSVGELEPMLAQLGFTHFSSHSTAADRGVLLASKRG